MKLDEILGENNPKVAAINKFFKDTFTDIRIIQNRDRIYYIKNDKYIMCHDVEEIIEGLDILWCSNNNFWLLLKTNFNLNNLEISKLVEYILERDYQIKASSITNCTDLLERDMEKSVMLVIILDDIKNKI